MRANSRYLQTCTVCLITTESRAAAAAVAAALKRDSNYDDKNNTNLAIEVNFDSRLDP